MNLSLDSSRYGKVAAYQQRLINTSATDSLTRLNQILFTKEEKDGERLKQLFNYYEYVGFTQTTGKVERVKRLYDLAYGKIDPDSFQEAKDDYTKAMTSMGEEPVDFNPTNLEYFSIIPNIVNVLKTSLRKKITKAHVQAINLEATNEIIESMNSDIRDLIVSEAHKLFEVELEGLDDQARQAKEEIFQKSQKIQTAYQTEVRLEIENWANHLMQYEDNRFNIKHIEEKLLEKQLVTEEPYIHINYRNNDYYPEILDEDRFFNLNSHGSEDVSESLMCGWFKFLTFTEVLSKYKIKEEDAKKLEEWHTILKGIPSIQNRVGNEWNDSLIENQTNKVRWLSELYNEPNLPNSLIRETTIYFIVPRKVGELTTSLGGVKYTQLVDESFKTTLKPIYDKTFIEENTVDNLVHGEHVDWFYINELYRGVKFDISTSQPNLMRTLNDYQSIWYEIKKHDIQYKDPFRSFGVRIPVHGGHTSQIAEPVSLVEKMSPWQTQYTFLGNRIKHLNATEIGMFYAFNQNMIPHESFDGTWGKNNLAKWAQLGHDLGVAPLEMGLNQLSGQAMQGGMAYGQVIDLTKTTDVMNKMLVMQKIKEECYAIVGITPQVIGEISAYQSSKSVSQGLQRSSEMVQHIYSRHKDIMRKARESMLQTAQYIASKNEVNQFTYFTNEKQRAIFKSEYKDFLLHDLAIFQKDDLTDLDKLEIMKQIAATDNTMGADIYEKGMLLMADSSSELMSNLKDLKIEKDRKIEEQRAHEQQMQQEQLAAAQKMQNEMMDREDARLDKKLKSEEYQSQIKAQGLGDAAAQETFDNIIKLQELNQGQQAIDLQRSQILNQNEHNKVLREQQDNHANQSQISKESIELLRIKKEEKAIEAQNKRTDAMIKAKGKEKPKSK